jgi:hypothetical protein
MTLTTSQVTEGALLLTALEHLDAVQEGADDLEEELAGEVDQGLKVGLDELDLVELELDDVADAAVDDGDDLLALGLNLLDDDDLLDPGDLDVDVSLNGDVYGRG